MANYIPITIDLNPQQVDFLLQVLQETEKNQTLSNTSIAITNQLINKLTAE